jgi:hypothetical protein
MAAGFMVGDLIWWLSHLDQLIVFNRFKVLIMISVISAYTRLIILQQLIVSL